MCPGAKRAPGVDHDGRRSGVRLMPGRSNPERADDHGDMEAPPLVLPPRRHWIDLDLIEVSAQVGKPCVVRVDDEGFLFLDEAGRSELEQLSDHLVESTRWNGDPRTEELAQRNALFSFSKNPSSGRYVLPSAVFANSSSSRRWSSFKRRGTATLTRTR